MSDMGWTRYSDGEERTAMESHIINPFDDPEFFVGCRPGHCGCRYGDCDRAKDWASRQWIRDMHPGVLGINDTGPRLTET